MKLGIDIGRVLIAPDGGGRGDTSFIGGTVEDALATPPYDGMFDAVVALTRRFGGRVWLVSKARPRMQEKTRLWLAHQRFFERTGIPAQHLRFCLERPQKADHCRELGLTHFVDDRVDVLGHLQGIVPRRYLFGPQRPDTIVPADVTPCASWPECVRTIEADLAARA
jgi:hypothetical protein